MNLSTDLLRFEPEFERWLSGQDLALARLLKNEPIVRLDDSDARRFEDALLAQITCWCYWFK